MKTREKIRRHMVSFHKVLNHLTEVLTSFTKKDEEIDFEIRIRIYQTEVPGTGHKFWTTDSNIVPKEEE